MTLNYIVWDIFDEMLDTYFAIDILLSFFTPIYINYFLITQKQVIAIHKIKQVWFWTDVISIVPWSLVINTEKAYLIMIKMTRLYRLVSLSLFPFAGSLTSLIWGLVLSGRRVGR